MTLVRPTPILAALIALTFTAGCASMSYAPRHSPFVKLIQVNGAQQYRVGDRDFAGGPFGGLADAVGEVPEARARAEEAAGDALTGLILTLLGSLLVGVGTGVTLASTFGGDMFGDGNAIVGPLLLIGGLGMTIGALSSLSSSTANQIDAINLFNDAMWERHGRRATAEEPAP